MHEGLGAASAVAPSSAAACGTLADHCYGVYQVANGEGHHGAQATLQASCQYVDNPLGSQIATNEVWVTNYRSGYWIEAGSLVGTGSFYRDNTVRYFTATGGDGTFNEYQYANGPGTGTFTATIRSRGGGQWDTNVGGNAGTTIGILPTTVWNLSQGIEATAGAHVAAHGSMAYWDVSGGFHQGWTQSGGSYNINSPAYFNWTSTGNSYNAGMNC